MKIGDDDASAPARKPGDAANPKEFRGWWLFHLARQPTVVNFSFVSVAILWCAASDAVQSQDGNPISTCYEPEVQYDMHKCMQWSVCGCEWEMGDDANTSQSTLTQVVPDGSTLVTTTWLTHKLGCTIQKVETAITKGGIAVLPPLISVSTKCEDPDRLVGYVYPGECKGSWERANRYVNTTDGNKTYSCAIQLPGSGMSPSSLIVTAAGVGNALILVTAPVFGTICGVTDKRRLLWKVSAATLTFCTYGLAILGTGHVWAASLTCKTISGIVSQYTEVAHLAYLPELGDKEVQGRAAGTGQGVGFLMQLFEAISVTIISILIGLNDVGTAYVSTCIAGTFLLIGSPLAISHMGDRPARTQLKGSAVKATFTGLYELTLTVRKEYAQAFIFLCSYAVGCAGASGIVTMASTYLVSELKLTGAGLGIVVAIVLLVGMPSAVICGRIMNNFGMKRVLLFVYAAWMTLGVITPLVMYKEEHMMGSYILGGLYGFFLATFFTVNPALFASLVPPKREAEFMGLYVFFGSMFSWLPLIIYGACDNSGGPRLGLGVCGTIFFFVAGVILSFVDMASGQRHHIKDFDAVSSGERPPGTP